MRKIVFQGLLFILLQSGLHAAEKREVADTKPQFRKEITNFIKSYLPSLPMSPLTSFDPWIQKINSLSDWRTPAAELLINLENTRRTILCLKAETSPEPEYDAYRIPLLQKHIDFLIEQHKQEFLVLNRRFSITNKGELADPDQKIYTKIVELLIPPTDEYLDRYKDEFFKKEVDFAIKTNLGLGETRDLTGIALDIFKTALQSAVGRLEKTQSYIDLLNAKESSGLKEEFKNKAESWQQFITRMLVGYNVNPTLRALRIEHHQLQIIRDSYIAIITALLTRELTADLKTSLKVTIERFQGIKEKRDTDQSRLLKYKKRLFGKRT